MKNGAILSVIYEKIKYLLNIFFVITLCRTKILLIKSHVRSVTVGPFFFADITITGLICQDMPEAFCFPKVDENGNPDIMFHEDEAPPDFCKFVTDASISKFPDRWSGRGGPILWLPCSPDLTPLTSLRRVTLLTSCNPRKFGINHLKERTDTAMRSISPDILERVWTRTDICRAANALHIREN
jgi:hypothetical protein